MPVTAQFIDALPRQIPIASTTQGLLSVEHAVPKLDALHTRLVCRTRASGHVAETFVLPEFIKASAKPVSPQSRLQTLAHIPSLVSSGKSRTTVQTKKELTKVTCRIVFQKLLANQTRTVARAVCPPLHHSASATFRVQVTLLLLPSNHHRHRELGF